MLAYDFMKIDLTHVGVWGGESISGDGGGSGEVYKGRAEPVLVSPSDLYSEDK